MPSFPRRLALTSSLGALLVGCVGRSSLLSEFAGLGAAIPKELTAEYLAELFSADAEPDLFLRTPEDVPRWKDLNPKPPVEWAHDSASADYRHLEVPMNQGAFVLTAAVLQRLAALNHFSLPASGEVLFGLRGCSLVSNYPFEGFSPRIEVHETVPNHLEFRCLIGVLRVDSSEVWAANASTVPNADYIYQCWQGGLNANLLPTGFHAYEVGPHNRGKPGTVQPGAFRQIRPVCVLRSKDDMSYRIPDDKWDYSKNAVVSDNIHAAVLDGSGALPCFSSAGCQTLPGSYNAARTVPTGVWAQFRVAAGLAMKPSMNDVALGNSSEDGRQFYYMLLTGREARLAGAGGWTERRARFGSRGQPIEKFRSSLGLSHTSLFDQQTMIALIEYQSAKGLFPDGILTPGIAMSLGFQI